MAAQPRRGPNPRRRMMGIAGAAIAAGTAELLAGRAPAAAAQADDTAPLAGVWVVTGRSQPGGQRPGGYRALWFLFPHGIVLLGQPPQQPTVRRDDPAENLEYSAVAGGAWQRTEFNTYAVRIVGLHYDARANPTTTATLTETITYDPLTDTWQGVGQLSQTDTDGRTTISFEVQHQATRVSITL